MSGSLLEPQQALECFFPSGFCGHRSKAVPPVSIFLEPHAVPGRCLQLPRAGLEAGAIMSVYSMLFGT